MRIGILGGGIAGLSIARLLDKSFDVTVLESASEFGGLCKSFEFRDFFVVVGPHIFFSKNKKILRLSYFTHLHHALTHYAWLNHTLTHYACSHTTLTNMYTLCTHQQHLCLLDPTRPHTPQAVGSAEKE